jgi:hypothetical protein
MAVAAITCIALTVAIGIPLLRSEFSAAGRRPRVPCIVLAVVAAWAEAAETTVTETTPETTVVGTVMVGSTKTTAMTRR